MAKQENLSFIGTVTEELGNSMFRVELDVCSQVVLCTISGKIRKNYIKIVAGDRVKLEVSPYDLTRGRIVTRLTGKENKVEDNSVNKPNNKLKPK